MPRIAERTVNSVSYWDSVYARGVENVAIFAAKIFAASNPETAEALKKMKTDKAKTYKAPDLSVEAFA